MIQQKISNAHPKRIGVIYMHPFSESMGSAVRVRELTCALSKMGSEIYILTPYEQSFDLFPNVHVISALGPLSKLGLSHPLYKITKALYYSSFFPQIFSTTSSEVNGLMSILTNAMAKQLFDLKIDIIQVEQDATVPIGIALKNKTGLPLVADIHNISSEELVAAKIFAKETVHFKNLQERTKTCLLQTDSVAVVSESMKSYVTGNYGLTPSKVTVVPPGGRLCNPSLIEKTNLSLKVVYAGLVAKREHVDLFIRSIPTILKKQKNASFYVTNKGEAIGDVKRLSNSLGVEPEYFWYTDYAEVNRLLSSCHLGILPSSDDIARRMGTPVKLFNYLSMGLPVVANDIGGWTDIIKDNEVGVTSEDDPHGFAEAVLSLIQNPSKMAQYRKNSFDLIRNHYNWDNSGQQLLNIYESIS